MSVEPSGRRLLNRTIGKRQRGSFHQRVIQETSVALSFVLASERLYASHLPALVQLQATRTMRRSRISKMLVCCKRSLESNWHGQADRHRTSRSGFRCKKRLHFRGSAPSHENGPTYFARSARPNRSSSSKFGNQCSINVNMPIAPVLAELEIMGFRFLGGHLCASTDVTTLNTRGNEGNA